jgi:hypothetical protein
VVTEGRALLKDGDPVVAQVEAAPEAPSEVKERPRAAGGAPEISPPSGKARL